MSRVFMSCYAIITMTCELTQKSFDNLPRFHLSSIANDRLVGQTRRVFDPLPEAGGGFPENQLNR